MISAGEKFTVDCPFVRDVFSGWDEDGQFNTLTWKPGVVWEQDGPEDVSALAHAMGKVRYTVVSVHKLPRPYPTRVFFTRRWVDPSGREFGRNNLRVMTVDAFRRRTQSYIPAGFDRRFNDLTVRDIGDDEKQKMLGPARDFNRNGG